ncbi:hypothetical protein ACWDR2_16600 [Streptomyces sp. NPDC003631]|jgi:hypothetical protein|uniref:Uncharacterized protein n=1 Tax=Streptomyces lannensis TaxID=766498 RepID=A0ABP7KLC9_9ACTN|nr:hypothetical protein [Streptomyces sp. WAC07094]TFV32950.1 hypothetical protein E4K10_27315 [Streptomyces sp. T1317-0309]
MAVDPTDPETFEEDEAEAAELDVEAPENDAAEQHKELDPEGDEPLTEEEILRANEADLVEQKRVVRIDEDDYR